MSKAESIIRVRGELELEGEHHHGEEIEVVVEIDSIEIKDNQDGDYTKIHKAKLRED